MVWSVVWMLLRGLVWVVMVIGHLLQVRRSSCQLGDPRAKGFLEEEVSQTGLIPRDPSPGYLLSCKRGRQGTGPSKGSVLHVQATEWDWSWSGDMRHVLQTILLLFLGSSSLVFFSPSLITPLLVLFFPWFFRLFFPTLLFLDSLKKLHRWHWWRCSFAATAERCPVPVAGQSGMKNGIKLYDKI